MRTVSRKTLSRGQKQPRPAGWSPLWPLSCLVLAGLLVYTQLELSTARRQRERLRVEISRVNHNCFGLIESIHAAGLLVIYDDAGVEIAPPFDRNASLGWGVVESTPSDGAADE